MSPCFYSYKTIFSDDFWPRSFLLQKWLTERHQRYHGTSYNLEPDIKALGDCGISIPMGWTAPFWRTTVDEMVEFGFLTEEERQELKRCLVFYGKFALRSI